MPDIEDLLAKISAGNMEKEGGWRPINSAPKDGTLVRIRYESGVADVRWRLINDDDPEHWQTWWDDDGYYYPKATHWMPLPAPPVEDA